MVCGRRVDAVVRVATWEDAYCSRGGGNSSKNHVNSTTWGVKGDLVSVG